MTDNNLRLLCLVDGHPISQAFSQTIPSTNTIRQLRSRIHRHKPVWFKDLEAEELILWHVSVRVPIDSDNGKDDDDDNDDLPILLNDMPKNDKRKLNKSVGRKASDVFGSEPDEETIHVIVQRPPPALKRDREGDKGPSSKRKRFDTYTLRDAIEAAGFSEKGVEDGQLYLSRLSNKERVKVLGFLGQPGSMADTFASLSSTAVEIQGTDIKVMDKISAPHNSLLPIVDTKDLYVRQAFKDL
ncbi:hypothetical protein BG005_000311 [Podila minutissima]|nr:hypothetical protein BG005_000311 [Podila minutissima]